MLSEKEIENKVGNEAKSLGFLVYKFVSPEQRGVPDRILLYKGRALFIEFKAPGKTELDPLQSIQCRKISEAGFVVITCNSIEDGHRVLVDFKTGVDDALA